MSLIDKPESQAGITMAKWTSRPWQLVDISSLVLFRLAFGIIVAWWAWDYLVTGRVQYMYVDPKFHFPYPWFSWVHPWSRSGMYLHFLSMVVFSAMVALGYWYRFASLALAFFFSYFFLLDRTNYQNHYYLMLLLSWLMSVLPAGQAVSWDAMRTPSSESYWIPAWNIWALRFLFGLPYFYGGIAKLSSDWIAGWPLRQTLESHAGWPVVGPLFLSEGVVQIFIWGGLLFDLTIVFWLLWSRTRWIAFLLCVAFHITNSVLFNIHVFPWLMILGTTLFFTPDWPRRWLGSAATTRADSKKEGQALSGYARGFRIATALGLVAFQLVLPLRHWNYSGDVNWTEQGHAFSWRMMLRGKLSVVRFYLTDEVSGETWNPLMRDYVNADQLSRFAMDPAMILQMGRFLAAEYRQKTGHTVQVRALALTSLNGRKAQLLVNPETDISSHSSAFALSSWVQPLTESRPSRPWTVPVREWEGHVKLPTMLIDSLAR